ncbi:hypothetical protein [Rickettsia tamurae]|uniref:hypothetical protein n=1 Tax=Rickettsia tamurae TaxID=334545 RepID=UPI000A4F2328|nr:hypothetical protein [Rickettsia tamurae]
MNTESSLRAGIVAWFNFTSVTPWLDHGMTQWVLPVHATMPYERLKGVWRSVAIQQNNKKNSVNQNF